jgi:Protein of unknown function (DUF1236)
VGRNSAIKTPSADSRTAVSPLSRSAISRAPQPAVKAQKTKIRETVIRSKDAPRVTNVNFNVSVGTVVPRDVRYAPLPTTLVDIYPQYRSYYYIVVNEEIVIIEPSSFKIVTIVNV